MQVPVGVVPGLGSAMMPGVADQYAQQVACTGKTIHYCEQLSYTNTYPFKPSVCEQHDALGSL